MNSKHYQIHQRIQYLRRTVNYDDWDGYGASALSNNVYEHSERFIHIMQLDINDTWRLPVPTADGAISFDFTINGYRILFEVFEDGSCAFCKYQDNKFLIGHDLERFNDSIIEMFTKDEHSN